MKAKTVFDFKDDAGLVSDHFGIAVDVANGDGGGGQTIAELV